MLPDMSYCVLAAQSLWVGAPPAWTRASGPSAPSAGRRVKSSPSHDSPVTHQTGLFIPKTVQ